MTKEREIYADSGEAIKRLVSNGIAVDTSTGLINIPMNKHVGIKLWGAVDYLQHRCVGKYNWCRVR